MQTDAETVDPLFFYGDPALPAVGVQHPENPWLRLKGVPSGTAIDKSLTAWNCDLVWTTKTLDPDYHEPDRYDDSLRATKRWSHRILEEPVAKAYVSDDGGSTFGGSPEPVASTAGEIYVPGLTKNRYLPVCTYTRNELSVPSAILSLPGAVNSDSITIDGLAVTAGQALIASVEVSEWKRFFTWSFRTVTYEIVLKPEGWDDVVLNQGLIIIKSGTPERAMLYDGLDVDSDERPLVQATEPVPLNSSSRNRDSYDTASPDYTNFTPHYRVFRHLTYTAFSAYAFS